MSTSYYSKFVKCPYYHEDTIKSILCEGVLRKSVIRQSFNTKKDKLEWQESYCNKIQGYEKCPVYCVACRKYEVKK